MSLLKNIPNTEELSNSLCCWQMVKRNSTQACLQLSNVTPLPVPVLRRLRPQRVAAIGVNAPNKVVSAIAEFHNDGEQSSSLLSARSFLPSYVRMVLPSGNSYGRQYGQHRANGLDPSCPLRATPAIHDLQLRSTLIPMKGLDMVRMKEAA
ncbi:hypothetical protein [Caldimonas tepidiphila]|uniref:hypothetical protein n=1 Tax=Caldimonas tepidiphila TaxID=2315841 RepID=UPI00130088FF|nr:hypothetical protein [Caldimonas tepidiphila]